MAGTCNDCGAPTWGRYRNLQIKEEDKECWIRNECFKSKEKIQKFGRGY